MTDMTDTKDTGEEAYKRRERKWHYGKKHRR